jgi:short-subunit dehydrogenase
MTSLTEVLHYQLLKEGSKIQASVLFPGPHLVNTGILNSGKSRPQKFKGDSESQPEFYMDFKTLAKNSGIAFQLTEPEEVAAYTLEGIKQNKFWILPPSEKQDKKVRVRTESILSRENPVYPE